MLVGCVSDTHLAAGKPVPARVIEALRGADAILHAGDILDVSVLEQLSEVAETIAVRGNMDRGPTAASLPEKRVLEKGGFRIGLIHGWGSPVGLASRVAASFEGDACDCIVFGHSHRPMNEMRGGVLMFNPGSPTDRMFARGNSVGMLELTDVIRGMIVDLPDRDAR